MANGALQVPEQVHNRFETAVLEVQATADGIPTLWIARDRLALKLMPADTDLMEMIPSASEAQAYRQFISSQTK